MSVDARDIDPLSAAILRELAQAPGPAGVSLPRLGKALGLGVSVVMRQLASMGSATLGGRAGPGWVSVTQHEERWVAALTATGRAFVAAEAHAQAAEPGSPAS